VKATEVSEGRVGYIVKVKEKPSKKATKVGGKSVKVIATNIPADRRAGQEGNTGKCNSSGETLGGVGGN
jgi:hypothetical protein